MQELRVKALWWEGSNLTVHTVDDRLMTFTNCYPVSTSTDEVAYDEASGLGEIHCKFSFDFKSQQ